MWSLNRLHLHRLILKIRSLLMSLKAVNYINTGSPLLLLVWFLFYIIIHSSHAHTHSHALTGNHTPFVTTTTTTTKTMMMTTDGDDVERNEIKLLPWHAKLTLWQLFTVRLARIDNPQSTRTHFRLPTLSAIIIFKFRQLSAIVPLIG